MEVQTLETPSASDPPPPPENAMDVDPVASSIPQSKKGKSKTRRKRRRSRIKDESRQFRITNGPRIARSAKQMPPGCFDNFMLHQPMFSWKNRDNLVDWIFDFQCCSSLSNITAFAAVNIFDRFLSTQVLSLEEIDYAAVAAIHIATKYHETQIYKFYSLDKLVLCCNGRLPDTHGLHRFRARIMEIRVLEELRWELEVPTVCTHLTGFLNAAENLLDSTTEEMAYFFAKLGIWNYRSMIAFPPEMLAAAALYTACESSISNTSMWRDTLWDITGFKDTQLVKCSERMLALHMVGNGHKNCNRWVKWLVGYFSLLFD